MKKSDKITDKMLLKLREDVGRAMSARRYAHTLEVEKMAARIGEIYCTEKIEILRAAALLHDMTKELPFCGQEEIFKKHGIDMTEELRNAPSTHHAMTAALEIPSCYPEFSDDDIVEAVRYHTTGRAGMSLCEKIIYLSDYIDMTRTYDDCVKLRNMFWDAEPEKMSEDEREKHIDRVILRSLEMTIRDLTERGKVICRDTLEARDSLLK